MGYLDNEFNATATIHRLQETHTGRGVMDGSSFTKVSEHPCYVSYKVNDSTIRGAQEGGVYEREAEAKIFVKGDVDIKRGDRITVTADYFSGTREYQVTEERPFNGEHLEAMVFTPQEQKVVE